MAEIHRAENPPVPENPTFTPYRGLQGRGLLADRKYLNPTIDIPLEEAPIIKSFAQRDYSVFENTSRFDRKTEWDQEVQKDASLASYDAQMTKWTQEVDTILQKEEHKEKIAQLPAFFQTTNADSLYTQYFANGGGVKKFVGDIVASFRTGAVVDQQALRTALPSIQWMASIFGTPSAEIITQMIDAEVRHELKDPSLDPTKPEFRADTNGINPGEHQYKLLEHLSGHATYETAQQALTPGEKKTATGEKWFPIHDKETRIIDFFGDQNEDQLFIYADTASGKTIGTPRFYKKFLEANPDQSHRKMAVLQPMQNLAETTAISLATIEKSEVGQFFGFQHGREKKVTPGTTRVTFMPERSLFRKGGNDNLFLDYTDIIVDEIHKYDGVVLGTIEAAQAERKRLLEDEGYRNGTKRIRGRRVYPLKIIVMTATPDEKAINKVLQKNKRVRVEVKRPYDLIPKFADQLPYLKDYLRGDGSVDPNKMTEAAAVAAKNLPAQKGRILAAFMPGARLIQSTIDRMKEQLEDANVLPYSAKLNKELKQKALHFESDKIEVRVTTNAADTGFTFENSDKEGPVMGVDVIVSGIVNHLRVDPETGLAWLEEIEDVVSSLEQQAGRAGRKADGTVIYLMSEANFKKREYLHTPSILEKDFTDDILGLINMGVDVRSLAQELDMDISERPIRLAYYPPRKSIERGISKLKILGAIDDDLKKTATGEAMLRFGKDYNFARALVEAQKIGYEEPLVTISLMHAKAPELFLRPNKTTIKDYEVEAHKQSFQIEGSDFLTLLNIWRQYSAQPEDKRQEWAAEHYLDIEMLKDIEADRARELKQLEIGSEARIALDFENLPQDEKSNIERCIVAGFRDKLLHGTGDKYKLRYYGPHVSVDGIDKYSVLYRRGHEWVVSSGNKPRPRKHEVYMTQNQVVRDPNWLTDEDRQVT